MKTNTKRSILSLFLATLLYLPSAWAAGEPQNVTGLSASATAEDTVTLSWNSAMDTSEEDPEQTAGLVDHYRIYYGPESVAAGEAPFYANELDTPNNNTSFVLTGLDASTTYYFAVTAFDGEENESIEYSLETSATTLGSGGDTEDTVAPAVVNAVALSNTQVLVRFSEEVVLPESAEVAFTIAEQLNPANSLEVTSAMMYAEDPSNEMVLLETASQTNGADYIVTVSSLVEDTNGNPVNSASTDSALFEGSDAAASEEEPQEPEEPAEEPEETTPPLNCGIANTNLPNETYESTMTCFENAFSTCSPATYIRVTGTGDQQENYQYEIMGVSDSNDQVCEVKSRYLKHPNADWVDKEMMCEYDFNNPFVDEEIAAITDLSQASCSGELYDQMLNNSPAPTEPEEEEVVEETPEEDTAAPEEVTNLTATFTEVAEKFMVALSWSPSVNTAQDLVDQILYQSVNSASDYDAGTSLGANATSYDVNDLEGGVEYYFKLTTKDSAGNESTGAIRSIRLPETGMGAGLLMLGSALGARQILRRRRRK